MKSTNLNIAAKHLNFLHLEKSDRGLTAKPDAVSIKVQITPSPMKSISNFLWRQERTLIEDRDDGRMAHPSHGRRVSVWSAHAECSEHHR